MLHTIYLSIGCNETERMLSKCQSRCFLKTLISREGIENTNRVKFPFYCVILLPLISWANCCFFALFGNHNFQFVKVIANVKMFVSSLAARDRSVTSSLSSLVVFLPSKDVKVCATSLVSIS